MITITCKLSPSELHKAMQVMARNNRSLLLTTFLGYMQIIIGFVLLAKGWISLHILSTSGIFFITTGFLFAFVPSIITRLKVNQLLQTDNAFTEKIIYYFSPEGYEAKAQTYRLNGGWKNIFQIKEAGGFLFIYLNKKTAMIISKSSFSPGQFSDFKNIIKGEQGLSYGFAKDKK
ncbi:MAG: YcxB family protein [Ginsengibacter sp.]